MAAAANSKKLESVPFQKENDFQVKKSQLLESLRGKLKKRQGNTDRGELRRLARYQGDADRLELFISLYEAVDGVKDIIASSVNEINLENIPLLLSDVHAVGFIMPNCTRLKTVTLSGCSLTSSSIQILDSSINNSNVKISNLDLSWNPLDATAMSCIGHIVKQCQVDSLDLRDCDLSSEGLENFKSSVGNSKISKLNLSSNPLDATAMSSIGHIVKQCQVDSLDLDYSHLSSEGLENFKSSVENSKISDLTFGVTSFDTATITLTLDIVQQCQVDVLKAWTMHNSQMNFFSKISELVLVKLQGILLDATAMSHIGLFIKQCQVDSFTLYDCNLSSEDLENFKSSAEESKISKLNLSKNLLDATAMSSIGHIVKQCQVDSLILCDCELSSEGLENFKSSVVESKISKLDLSKNSLDVTAMSSIGRIVKQCQVDSLILCFCKLSSEGLENFKSFVGESKISVLDLSNDLFNNDKMQNDISGSRAVESLIPLLPNVTKELKLPEDIPEEHRQLLQHELNKLHLTKLKIFGLDQSNKEEWILEQNVGFGDDVLQHYSTSRSDYSRHKLYKLRSPKLKIVGLGQSYKEDWTLKQHVEDKWKRPGASDESNEESENKRFDGNEDIERHPSPGSEIEEMKSGFDDDDDDYSTSSSEFDYSIYDKPAVKRKSGSESYEEVCKVLESSNTAKLFFEEIEFTSQCMMKIRDAIAERKFADIEFDSCHFSEQILSDWLKYDWKSIKITSFRLHGCIFHGDINAHALLHVIKKWKVETLDMSKCQMMLKEAAKTLENGLQDSTVTKFLYNYNMNMTLSDVKAISQILQNHHFKVVEIMECNLTHDLLQHIVDSTLQVDELNLSFNRDLGNPSCQKTIGSVSRKLKVQRLSLRDCNITESGLELFSKSLAELKLSSIDLSRNKQLCDGDMKILAEFLNSHDVNELALAHCDLDQDKLQKLHNALVNSQVKLVSLNIQSNMKMKAEAFEIVGKIVKGCRLKSLNISECRLTENKLQTLVESLRSNRAKLEELDISEQGFILSRRIVIEAVHLLDYVETKLNLCYRKIGENNRKGLQRALDLKKDMNLKIFLDHKVDILQQCRRPTLHFG